MLRLPDRWVWDSWVVDDGERYHLFYLHAPRSLGDPELRHWNVSIGHAVSDDLVDWRVLPDALAPSPRPAWDDLATWTGSVVRAPDGRWLMFYTGASSAEDGLVQRIGVAESDDLTVWHRLAHPPLSADPRWYERLGESNWHDEAWRDPYVVADPDGDGWHMLITARSRTGPTDTRGIIGHARSPDLMGWEVQAPLTTPGGFGHLEVPQVETVEGMPLLVFSCGHAELGEERRRLGGQGGVYTVAGQSLLGPFEVAAATRVDAGSLYSGRLVRDRSNRWQMLGFRGYEAGHFVGEVIDPIHVTVSKESVVLQQWGGS